MNQEEKRRALDMLRAHQREVRINSAGKWEVEVFDRWSDGQALTKWLSVESITQQPGGVRGFLGCAPGEVRS